MVLIVTIDIITGLYLKRIKKMNCKKLLVSENLELICNNFKNEVEDEAKFKKLFFGCVDLKLSFDEMKETLDGFDVAQPICRFSSLDHALLKTSYLLMF